MVTCFAFILVVPAAMAHSPYLEGRAVWSAPDGTNFEIAFIYGDSIIGFASDPGRPVVLDAAGKVVALGPRIKNGLVHCSEPDHCAILLSSFLPTKVVPNQKSFRPGRDPDFYPEFEKEEYGFEPVPMTLSDHGVVMRQAAVRHPWLLASSGALGILCSGLLAACGRFERRFPARTYSVTAIAAVGALFWVSAVILHILYLGSRNWFLWAPPSMAFVLLAVMSWYVLKPRP